MKFEASQKLYIFKLVFFSLFIFIFILFSPLSSSPSTSRIRTNLNYPFSLFTASEEKTVENEAVLYTDELISDAVFEPTDEEINFEFLSDENEFASSQEDMINSPYGANNFESLTGDYLEFRDIFTIPADKCGWWKRRFTNWQKKYFKNRLTGTLKAVQEHSGFGDRLHGLTTALQHAISYNKTLEIYWSHIDELFQVPVELSAEKDNSEQRLLLVSGEQKLIYNNQCQRRSYFDCNPQSHVEDHCPVYNRACLKGVYCRQIKQHSQTDSGLKISEVMGCPIRLMLQPKVEFLDMSLKYSFQGQIKTQTIRKILQFFRQNFVVSVHLRLGDKSLREGRSDIEKITETLNDFHSCIPVIERDSSSERPIIWFVASDDVYVREYFQTHHSDKSFVLITRPQHMQHLIGDEPRRKNDIKEIFAEWFLLGQGNELVVNDAHKFGVSAFSRSAWLYNLKDEFYLLRKMSEDSKMRAKPANLEKGQTCIRKMFDYEGSLRRVSPDCL